MLDSHSSHFTSLGTFPYVVDSENTGFPTQDFYVGDTGSAFGKLKNHDISKNIAIFLRIFIFQKTPFGKKNIPENIGQCAIFDDATFCPIVKNGGF